MEFERKWIAEMAPDAVQLMDNDFDVRNKESFQKTLKAIDRKEKVLTKVALMWSEEKIYGSADVVAHTSWLYKKFPHLKPETPEPDHYCILDLKMTSRLDSPSKADDLHIASNQVKIYTYILGHLQGYMPRRAFLVTRDRIFDPLIVEVEEQLSKPLSSELRSHRREYTKIKLHGDKMKPWRDEEVKPNFGNKKDAPWSQAKEEIKTERIPGRSLTMLPGVDPTLAQALMDKGYTSLDNLLKHKPETLSLEEVDGIGETLAKRIRAVLTANRSRKPTPVSSDCVPKRADIELFVDFETFNNLNIDFDRQWPNLDGTEMIFMVGVGYQEGRAWKQRNFVTASESHATERKMLKEFLDFLEERGVFDFSKSVAIYHWTSAEVTSSEQAAKRHNLKRLDDLPFVDLYKVFANMPIGIPNCWDYSLKNVATAIGQYDPRFHIEWKDVVSGSQAMVMGWSAYAQSTPLETPEMAWLQNYLSTDVKAVWQALRWLRDAAKSERKAMGWYTSRVGITELEVRSVGSGYWRLIA